MAATFSLFISSGRPSILRIVSLAARRYTNTTVNNETESTFDALLQSSRFLAHCGETPVGQKVVANIIAERDNDIYVDFGGKFHAVVKRPKRNGHLYTTGKWVDVILEEIEVTEHFLGDSKDTSLLEGKVKLIGLSNFKPH